MAIVNTAAPADVVDGIDGVGRKPKQYLFRTLLLFICVAVLSWPAFVVVSIVLSTVFGEATVMNAWQLQPKRLLLDQFIAGFYKSLVLTVPVALLAVLDYRIIVRLAKTPRLAGLLWFVCSVALTLIVLQFNSRVVWPVLLTAVSLFCGYRLFLWVFRMKS